MNRLSFWLLICIGYQQAFPQSKAAIDSINNIAFETKVGSASTLHKVFEKNAIDAQKLNYTLGVADSYSNLALVYYYQGKYSQNVDYSLKAIKIYQQLGATDRQAYEYAGLGYSMKRRNMQQAQYLMQKGKQIAEKYSHTKPLLSIYNNYGVLKEMQNQLDSALLFYRKGLALKESVNDSLGIPFSLNCIGGIYLMQKKFNEAEMLFQQALQIRIKRNDTIGIAENYTWLGDLYSAKQKPATAIFFYRKSLDLALAHKYLYLAQTNYKSISESYEALNNKPQALDYYKNYAAIRDSLVNKETNEKIAELEVQFETKEKEKQLAEANNILLIKNAEAKQNRLILAGTLIVLVFIALLGFLVYRVQRSKNIQLQQEHQLKTAILRIEAQNKLQEQRLAIARDLHDNIGSQLTFIISSVENIKYALNFTNQKLDKKLQSISSFARDTIVELRDTIWAMNASEIPVEELAARIISLIDKAKAANGSISYHFHVDDTIRNLILSSVQGMNVYRTIQEAVNNSLKYSGATLIAIEILDTDDAVTINVSDNGKGFDLESAEMGNGLKNMNQRISDIGGAFNIISSETGTSVSIKLSKNSDHD